MEKYIFKNYRARCFSHKTFEEQGDYYIVADVIRADNPAKILDVVSYWGSGEEVVVRKFEEQSVPLPEKFNKPFYGEFVTVPCDTPLLSRYTDDDAYRGLCDIRKVGTYVCNSDGSYRIFKSIRVFCVVNPAYVKVISNPRLKNASCLNIPKYLPMWEPEYRAEHKKRYCYVEMSDKKND